MTTPSAADEERRKASRYDFTATFTPGQRRGPGLAETIGTLQRLVDEQGLAAPVTSRQ